jgi:hypothetical protein
LVSFLPVCPLECNLKLGTTDGGALKWHCHPEKAWRAPSSLLCQTAQPNASEWLSRCRGIHFHASQQSVHGYLVMIRQLARSNQPANSLPTFVSAFVSTIFPCTTAYSEDWEPCKMVRLLGQTEMARTRGCRRRFSPFLCAFAFHLAVALQTGAPIAQAVFFSAMKMYYG